MGIAGVIRIGLLVGGVLLIIAGFGVIALAPGLAVSALWLIGTGGVMLLAGALERTRYRSEAAERSAESAGPGGGETPGDLEARFRPTDEVFVDPTTQRRMRVLLDRRTGERRYVAED